VDEHDTSGIVSFDEEVIKSDSKLRREDDSFLFDIGSNSIHGFAKVSSEIWMR